MTMRALTRDPESCSHPNTVVRRKLAANGHWMVGRQCLECGYMAGSWIGKKDWPEEIGLWDVELAGRKAKQANEAFIEAKEARRKADKSEFFSEHNVYLQSEAWQSLRRRVKERAGDLCEGCRNCPGTQAHHLTYDHWRNELLFELVWICEDCHEKAHGRALGEEP